MSQISAKTVKELRDRTGLGMMECKKALEEAGVNQVRPKPPKKQEILPLTVPLLSLKMPIKHYY